MRRTGALLAVLLTLLALPAVAGATPQWFAPQPISPFDWMVTDSAIAPDGRAVALLSASGVLAATTREPGGAFGAPEGLPFITGDEPQIGIDDHGGMVVAWRSQPSGRVQTTTREAGGAWTPPVYISAAGDFNSNYWELEVGRDGTAAIAWRNGGGDTVRVREPGGSWGAAEQVNAGTGTAYLDAPRLAVSGLGSVFVFLSGYSNTGDNVYYAERAAGGSFLPTKVALADVGPMPGTVETSENGNLALAWVRPVPDTPDVYGDYETVVRFRAADADDFGPPRRIAAYGTDVALSVADDGDVLAAWREGSADNRRAWIRSSTLAPDGSLSPVQTISPTSGVATAPEVGMDALGGAVAIWNQAGPQSGPWPGVDPTHVEGAVSTGGQFSAPQALSGSASTLSSALAVSAEGTAVAVWTEQTDRSCVKAIVRAETSQPGNAQTCAQVRRPVVPGGGPQDSTPPSLKFAGSKTQRLSGAGIAVTASCTESCVLSASGSVSVGKAARVYRLKSVKTKFLPAGRKAKLKLKLSKKSYKAVRMALKRHRRVTVSIKVVAKDRLGNRKTFKRKLRVKARR